MSERKTIKQIAKALLLLLPGVLGVTGLILEKNLNIFDALYQTIDLYTLGYSAENNGVMVEVARWVAPLATASGVVMALKTLSRRFRRFYLYCNGCCTAVYGPSQEKEAVLAQLDGHGVDGGDHFVKAQSYILLGSEDENLAFYSKHRDKLTDSMVYLQCSSLTAQVSASAKLRLFCPEEIAVRLFWKNSDLYQLSCAAHHKLDIVFVGFGKLGEELLLSGLQNNIFHPDQHITYHIFGEDNGFTATHLRLKHITDSVEFYDTPWYDSIGCINSAAMVVVLDQKGQLTLLRQLTLASARPTFHVFTADPCGTDIMDQKHRLTVFDWKKAAGNLDNLFRDTLNDRAKRINLRYAHLYSNVEETEENKQIEWEKLDTFTRYSNISSADYHEVQRAMLASAGISAEYECIPDDWRELLSELEHIRWCRYHYLNNWTYGIPTNGKRKDAARRIHADLVDYDTLTEAEKDKDRENIRILFSV